MKAETEWRQIKGYEGYYEVSNTGIVRSMDRHPPRKNGSLGFYPSKNLKQTPSRKGYPRVKLFKDSKGKDFYVHRLLMETFSPAPHIGLQVNHIDGDKTNNHINNLEWLTCQENIIHAVNSNLFKASCKKKAS